MITPEQILWEIVKKIEPSSSQKDAASRSHNHLRELLNQGGIGNRISSSYLSGSYARDTAVAPIDDVDIIFIIRPNSWQNGLLAALNPLPNTTTVLDSFANAIRYRYPVSSVFGQRRSVRLSLNHLDIDIVPAIDCGNDLVRVPDKDSNTWILSSPKIHSANATTLNKKFDGKFKPLIKLAKFWNGNLPKNAQLKSFTIETILVRLFQTVEMQSLTHGLYFFFDFISFLMNQPTIYSWKHSCGITLKLFQQSIPDVANTGSNTAHGIEWTNFLNFSKHTGASKTVLYEASNGSSDHFIANKVMSVFRIN